MPSTYTGPLSVYALTSINEPMNRSDTETRRDNSFPKVEASPRDDLASSNDQLQLIIMVLGLLVAILELLSTFGVL